MSWIVYFIFLLMRQDKVRVETKIKDSKKKIDENPHYLPPPPCPSLRDLSLSDFVLCPDIFPSNSAPVLASSTAVKEAHLAPSLLIGKSTYVSKVIHLKEGNHSYSYCIVSIHCIPQSATILLSSVVNSRV